MRLSDDQFEIMISNPSMKFKFADIGSKIAYIPSKGTDIYINVDLSECADDVLMAILYALSSLWESKNSPWEHLDSGDKLTTVLEDCYVTNRYMKNLYPFILLNEDIPITHMEPEAITRAVIVEFGSNPDSIRKFLELSSEYGCPFVAPSGSSGGITVYGDIDFNQIMSESSLNSDDKVKSPRGKDGNGKEKENEGSPNGKSQGFSSSPKYGYLTLKQKRLSECLTMFFSQILDRGKRFKLDSLKLYNRQCRPKGLMYTSISKKVSKSQDRLGILLDVSGSMDLDTISTLVNILKDDLLSVFSMDSLVLCWDTHEVNRYLVSELPSKLRHGGGTKLAGGVDTLVRENCRTIVVYSDFGDDLSLSKACIEAKNNGVRMYFCNPDSLLVNHKDNEISSTDNFIQLWNSVVDKMSIHWQT